MQGVHPPTNLFCPYCRTSYALDGEGCWCNLGVQVNTVSVPEPPVQPQPQGWFPPMAERSMEP